MPILPKKIKLIGLIVIVFALIRIQSALAEVLCSDNGYTIVTINGIRTDEDHAMTNAEILKWKLNMPSFNNEPVNVKYLFNPTRGTVADLVDSGIQKTMDGWSTFDDVDLIESVIKSAGEKITTQKVLLVGHSQGNFYANGFYDKVAGKEGGIPKESLGVYSVATPSNYVAGGGKWLTSDTDKVIAKWVGGATFRNVLKANTHIELEADDDPLGHDFTGVYLKYRASNIVNDIRSALGTLKASAGKNVNKPCMLSQKGDLIYAVDKTVLTTTDFAANVVVKAKDAAVATAQVLGETATNVATATGNFIGGVAGGISSVFTREPEKVSADLLSANVSSSAVVSESPAKNDNSIASGGPKAEEITVPNDGDRNSIGATSVAGAPPIRKNGEATEAAVTDREILAPPITSVEEAQARIAEIKREIDKLAIKNQIVEVEKQIAVAEKEERIKELTTPTITTYSGEIIRGGEQNDSAGGAQRSSASAALNDSDHKSDSPAENNRGGAAGISFATSFREDGAGNSGDIEVSNRNGDGGNGISLASSSGGGGSGGGSNSGGGSSSWSPSSGGGDSGSSSGGNGNSGGSGGSQPKVYPKILISEIQTSPTANRFIELYNPTSGQVDLTDWYIQRKTQNADEFASLITKAKFEGKSVAGNGYFLISREQVDGADIVFAGLTLTDANAVQLKNPNGDVADKVGWGAATDCEGNCAVEIADIQSIQRKYSAGLFIDTDKNADDFEIRTCPSPKAQTKTCEVAPGVVSSPNPPATTPQNQPPTVVFSFLPQSPLSGGEVAFDASSSTDSDGSIVSYKWDFGDGATATNTASAATHTYTVAGSFIATLIAVDDKNTSSAAVSKAISVSAPPAIPEAPPPVPPAPVVSAPNHLLISEVYPDKTGANSDFVELYNPTGSAVVLKDYELRVLPDGMASPKPLASFSASDLIAPKGFFLVGLYSYASTGAPADILRASYSLPTEKSAKVILLDGANMVDEFAYDKAAIEAGKSFERKAIAAGACVSAVGVGGKFAGNGCDTDKDADDFEINASPNPQNSASLPEPRTKPLAAAPSSMMADAKIISYDKSKMELDFAWSVSKDYSGGSTGVAYKITNVSGLSPKLSDVSTAETSAKIKINEVGRDYKFSLQAFDKDGLGSDVTEETISIPSFLTSLYFYKDPRTAGDALVEAYYDSSRPIPDLYDNFPAWQLVVFYLNGDASAIKEDVVTLANNWYPADTSKVLKVGYQSCGNGNVQRFSLPMPDNDSRCGDLGEPIYALDSRKLEDPHFIVKAVPDLGVQFSQTDYITAAYYSFAMSGYGQQTFGLVAADRNKYFFSDAAPAHRAPTAPAGLAMRSYTTDAPVSAVTVAWTGSTDSDTPDRELKYQYGLNNSDFQNLDLYGGDGQPKLADIALDLGASYTVYLRAVDDFGDLSPSVPLDITLPAAPAINLTPDPSNPYFAIDEAKIDGGLLKIKWRLLANPNSDGVFGIIPFESTSTPQDSSAALHKSISGFTTTAGGGPCNSTITGFNKYIRGWQYTTEFSKLGSSLVTNDLVGKTLKFNIYNGTPCSFGVAEIPFFSGYPVIIQ